MIVNLFRRAPILCLLLALAAEGHAQFVYQYTGVDFTNISGPYTTSDHVTVTMTLGAPLLQGGTYPTLSPSAFTITDGFQTLTQSSPGLDDVVFSNFSVDFAQPIIERWTVYVQAKGNFTLGGLTYDQASIGTQDNSYPPTDEGLLGTSPTSVQGYNQNSAAYSWALLSTPETPSIAPLALGAGLAVLGPVLGRKRKRV